MKGRRAASRGRSRVARAGCDLDVDGVCDVGWCVVKCNVDYRCVCVCVCVNVCCCVVSRRSRRVGVSSRVSRFARCCVMCVCVVNLVVVCVKFMFVMMLCVVVLSVCVIVCLILCAVASSRSRASTTARGVMLFWMLLFGVCMEMFLVICGVCVM